MPTPPLPAGVAMATMVSMARRMVVLMAPCSQSRTRTTKPPCGGSFASLRGGGLGLATLGRRSGLVAVFAQHPPLLQQAERAVGDPVQHQTGREEDHHHP